MKIGLNYSDCYALEDIQSSSAFGDLELLLKVIESNIVKDM